MKTEIYGTLGPACADTMILKQMFESGMTGVRLNLSHTNLISCQDWLDKMQGAALMVGIIPKLLIDLQGPELRIGDIIPVTLANGDTIILGEGGIVVPPNIFEQMKSGQEILLDDGKILVSAAEIIHQGKQSYARCTVLRGGLLQQKKSLALPGLECQIPLLTQQDRANLAHLKEYGVTGVMQPFVQGAKDLEYVRAALQEVDAGKTELYAKIENVNGVNKLTELLPNADHIVIARGDLGNSMPLWELPRVQYQISKTCKSANKPYMVVTQMLASMERSAVPTRAEVSDIFYAVLHGASAVMLTGETAAGAYPAEAMAYMCQTVREAEKQRL